MEVSGRVIRSGDAQLLAHAINDLTMESADNFFLAVAEPHLASRKDAYNFWDSQNSASRSRGSHRYRR